MPTPVPIAKGSLDVMILKSLSWGPRHGFEITRWLEERSSKSFEVEDNAMYQAVHRMEERGLVRAEWGVTANNRQARYYQITPQGRVHLRTASKTWLRFAATLSDILTATA